MASPSTSHDIDVEAQPVVSQHPVVSQGGPGEEGVTPECGGTTGQTPTRVEHNDVQSGAETHIQHVVDHSQGGRVADPDNSSQDPRMIGDFEGSANSLWSLYGQKQRATTNPGSNFEGRHGWVLIFVRPYFLRA
ncbi:hypothetical protein BGY98DRAFT_1097639 [Russula aff. rugulosa BPL654]|nr:hypothetical protein BGY98DRAFT_1097639 [Russula aff. rugulosa BPL654]